MIASVLKTDAICTTAATLLVKMSRLCLKISTAQKQPLHLFSHKMPTFATEWKNQTLLTRYVFFAEAGMAVPAASIFYAIN
jgi:hypothetical protein